MIFTAEVKAALATLRNAAQNDFERHRLDVLEQDLSSPPKVEVIDDTHQKFNGVMYTPKKGETHFRTCTGIHRDVWIYHHGEIPDGCQIHHIDHNPANNNISNLQCLTKIEHSKKHWNEAELTTAVCIVCGKLFTTYKKKQSSFCSEKCRQESYKENRVCEVCGKNFSCSRYSPTTTCSPKCASENRRKLVRRKREFTCTICGKTFFAVSTGRNKYCSQSCCSKAHWKRNHSNKVAKYDGSNSKSKLIALAGVAKPK